VAGKTKTKTKNKTNSMRFLEQSEVPYGVHEFPPDVHSAVGVAEHLGFPVREVYKTLVVMPPGRVKPILIVIQGDLEVDLKSVGMSLREKGFRMATHQEAERLTGLQVGGISALALMNKQWPVYVDTHAEDLTEFVVSAGKRGINLRLKVKDFMAVTGARWLEVTDA
jgi:Cys-tRNA(Pro)/Cys-tRNA(Cys) deacylase